jgi:hypothetical protein
MMWFDDHWKWLILGGLGWIIALIMMSNLAEMGHDTNEDERL